MFFFLVLRQPPITTLFPTRRSSDLLGSNPEGTIVWLLAVALLADTADRHSFKVPLAATESLDRKSTRLNSSHMSRSYAVFCLKKNKPNTSETSVTNVTHQ